MDADPRDALIQRLPAENASLRETIKQLTERESKWRTWTDYCDYKG
jgi:hypothetical protein